MKRLEIGNARSTLRADLNLLSVAIRDGSPVGRDVIPQNQKPDTREAIVGFFLFNFSKTYLIAIPAERAEPAMIFIAASTSFADKSFIFRSAIS